jgi:putative flippase GtrA
MDTPMRRWWRFNLVGLAGFVLQLALLAILTRMTTLPLGVCVAIAVLVTVSHNFIWHVRYTWPSTQEHLLRRWVAFNLSNGAVSLACNVIVTVAIAEAGVPLIAANVAAIGVASVVNFLVSDRLVFAAAGRPAVHQEQGRPGRSRARLYSSPTA